MWAMVNGSTTPVNNLSGSLACKTLLETFSPDASHLTPSLLVVCGPCDFGYSCLFHLAAHLKTILLFLKLELAGPLALGSNAVVPSADLASIIHVDLAINIAPAAVC